MKYKFTLLLLVFSSLCIGQNISSSTKSEFLNAIRNKDFSIDENIKVTKNKIVINPSYSLWNNSNDENYSKYNYWGSWGSGLHLIFIEKEDYNGSIFFVLDKKNKFKKTSIQGKPFLFENSIITVNIENTTDNKNILSIYKFFNDRLIFLNSFSLKEDIIVKDLRVWNETIYIKDLQDRYWKLKHP